MEILKLATLFTCVGFVWSVEIFVKIELGGNVTSLFKEEIITARNEEGLREAMTKKLEEILSDNPTDDVTITTEFRHGNEVHTTHVTSFDVSTSHQDITTTKLYTTAVNNDVTTDEASSTRNQRTTTEANDVTTDVALSTKSQPSTTESDDVTTPYVTDNVFSTRSVTSAITTPYIEPTTTDTEIPKTWHKASNNFYYKLFNDTVDYATAKSRCREVGADLASAGVRDQTVSSEILESVVKPGQYNTWIGLDDIIQEGRFIWADGVNSTRENTNWSRGEPNNSAGNEDCAHLSFGISWKLNDMSCSKLLKYLCEYRH